LTPQSVRVGSIRAGVHGPCTRQLAVRVDDLGVDLEEEVVR